jgi:hypothetical protein
MSRNLGDKSLLGAWTKNRKEGCLDGIEWSEDKAQDVVGLVSQVESYLSCHEF